MKVTIAVDSRVESLVNEVLTRGYAITDDGADVKSVGKQLREIRKSLLYISRDPVRKKSIITLSRKVENVERKRRTFGGSIFEVIFR